MYKEKEVFIGPLLVVGFQYKTLSLLTEIKDMLSNFCDMQDIQQMAGITWQTCQNEEELETLNQRLKNDEFNMHCIS